MRDKNTITILHVDDEESFLEVTALFLKERTGGRMIIDSIINPKQVLEKIKHKEYDVVISDYRMPEMDGLQLLKLLRDQNNEIPFIILTGQGREEVAIDALNLGANRYITKGMDSESMYQELHHAIITVVEFRHTQEALHESEEILRDLVRSRTEYLEKLHNTLSDAVFSVKLPERTIEYVNPSIERIFGYKPEECINKSTRMFYPSKEGFGSLGKKLREAMENNQSIVHNEYSLKRKNGEVFPSEITTTFFKEDDKFTKIITIVRDISERNELSAALQESEKVAKVLQESEEAHRKSEERLKQAVQIAKLGFWEWDIITGDLYWSDEGFRSIGDEPQSYKPSFDKFTSMLHPEDVEFVQEQVNAALNDNKDYSHDFRYLYPNGDIRHFHTQGEVTYDKNGKAIRFVGTQQDITEQIEFQQARQENEERLRGFMDSATYNFNLFDSKLNFVEINEISRKVFGLPKEEIIGKNMIDLNPELKGSQRLKEYFEVIKTGKNFDTEVEFENKFFTVRAFKAGDGMGMVSTDITKYKQAEKALRESDDRFRMLNEACFDGIVIHDKGRIVEANQAWLKMFGYNYSDLATIDGIELIVPKEREEIRTLILSKSEESYEAQAIKKDASTFPIEVRAKSFSFENQVFRVASVRDMSDRKQAEKALQESEVRFRMLSEASFDGIVIHDEGGIIDTNQAFAKMLGYNLSDLPTSDIYNLIAPKEREKARTQVLSRFEGTYETQAVRKNGSTFPIEVRVKHIPFENQTFRVASVRDISDRKQAERALRESEERIQLAVEGTGDGIWDWNVKTREIVIDDKLKKTLRYPPGEQPFDYQWLKKSIEPESFLIFEKALDDYVKGRCKYYELEYPVKSKIGDYIWIWARGKCVEYDDKGQPLRFIGTHRDITERKHAEKALKGEKDKAQQFLDIAGVLIASLNTKGEVTLINKKGCKLLGYSADEMIGKNWFDTLLPKELRVTVKEVFYSLMAGNTESVGYFETPVLTKSGKERLIGWHNTVLYDDAGVITGTLASGEDITERKQAENEMKNRLKLEQLVTRLSSDFVNLPLEKVDQMITNTLKDIAEFAGAVRSSLFLYSDDLLTVTNTHEWCENPENSQIALLQNIPSNSFGYYWELLQQKKNVVMGFKTDLPPEAKGEWEWAREHGWQSLLFVPTIFEGKLYGTMGFYGEVGEERQWSDSLVSLLQYVSTIVTNTLERKRIEEALQKSVQELQDKNKELHDFAFILTHDCKTPVRNVKLYSDLVLRESGDILTDKAKDYVTSIIAQTTHMEALIDGIYQYSKIDPFSRKIERIDLNELLSELMDILTPADNIEIDFSTELPVIDIDRTQMVQVFSNLIGNAIKFMDKPKGHITIRCEDKDNFWQFSVVDNGPGIEKNDFEKIFKIFQTLGTKKGTGLGLAIVKRIVEVNGGKIWLESTVGEGSTFYFTLQKQH